jgi:hypothetical protein
MLEKNPAEHSFFLVIAQEMKKTHVLPPVKIKDSS